MCCSKSLSSWFVMLIDLLGPAPVSTRWTVLCLDMVQILNIYLNRRYSYLKSIRLCANMSVRNLFTSDTLYQPGSASVYVICLATFSVLKYSLIEFHVFYLLLRWCILQSDRQFLTVGTCTTWGTKSSFRKHRDCPVVTTNFVCILLFTCRKPLKYNVLYFVSGESNKTTKYGLSLLSTWLFSYMLMYDVCLPVCQCVSNEA